MIAACSLPVHGENGAACATLADMGTKVGWAASTAGVMWGRVGAVGWNGVTATAITRSAIQESSPWGDRV